MEGLGVAVVHIKQGISVHPLSDLLDYIVLQLLIIELQNERFLEWI